MQEPPEAEVLGVDSDIRGPASTAFPIRSVLFAPACERRKLARLGSFDADAVVIDLEDAVPPSRKDESRALARAALGGLVGAVTCVRVNGMESGRTEDDVKAVVVAGLDALVLPKADEPSLVQAVDEMISAAETAASLPLGSIRLLPLIESGAGIANARQVAAASERIDTLMFGSGDFTLDLALPRLRWSREGTELAFARGKLVVDAAAAHRRPPLDGPYLIVADLAGFESDSITARDLGFQGRVCIHPTQVAVANRVFSPDPRELELCHRVVERFAAAAGEGASMVVEGLFVDYAIARKADRLIAVAAALDARASRRGKQA